MTALASEISDIRVDSPFAVRTTVILIAFDPAVGQNMFTNLFISHGATLEMLRSALTCTGFLVELNRRSEITDKENL